MALRNVIKAALQWMDAEETVGPKITEACQSSTSPIHQNPKPEYGAMLRVKCSWSWLQKKQSQHTSFQKSMQKCGRPVCCNYILQIGSECR